MNIGRFLRISSAVVLTAVLAACSVTPDKPEWERDYPIASGNVRFKPQNFSQLPQTKDSDWVGALRAFRLSCSKMGSHANWTDVCLNAQFVDEDNARAFFEKNFDVYRVGYVEKGVFSDTGLATGYYEPMLRGSRTRRGQYRYPIYGIPDDLITVDLTSLHPQLKGLRLRGKVQGRRLVPYDTRAAIEKRDDLKRDHVLCWVDNAVEAFFLQIQGSGRVLLDDGTFLRVGYGDQNGHPYKALGSWLIANVGMKRSEMSMQRIKAWIKDHPNRTSELLNTNPNFVFFEERPELAPEDGPLGAQGVPLTAGHSVAVDRQYWPMGVPFVIDVKQDNPAMAFACPVVAQDTGGAIRGPVRFDYFWGYGDAAGQSAGSQKSDVAAWVLMPKGYPLQTKN